MGIADFITNKENTYAESLKNKRKKVENITPINNEKMTHCIYMLDSAHM